MSKRRSMVRQMVTWFAQADVAEAQAALEAIKGVLDGKLPARSQGIKRIPSKKVAGTAKSVFDTTGEVTLA